MDLDTSTDDEDRANVMDITLGNEQSELVGNLDQTLDLEMNVDHLSDFESSHDHTETEEDTERDEAQEVCSLISV